jgi:hypothetical protein
MWQDEWERIGARIEGFEQAVSLANRVRVFATYEFLLDDLKEVLQIIRQFYTEYDIQLPPFARERLVQLSERIENDQNRYAHHIELKVTAAAPLLLSLRSQLAYILKDTEIRARSLVIRALSHLQRLIVAAPDVGEQWNAAFESGEIACEKLGATHLLWHGVWAFKAHAEGERTDLVLGTPLRIDEARTSAEAMVLTEWKKVLNPSNLKEQHQRALDQAKRYSCASGSLGGFELSARRFLILVTRQQVEVPEPVVIEGVTYEAINVAVAPTSPSKSR